MVRVLAACVLCIFLTACSLGTALRNRWQEETDRLHGGVAVTDIMLESWQDIDRAWNYLGEGRCAEALLITDLVWGREFPGWFEDVTILRLRALMCLAHYDEAAALARWVKVMFPWRYEEAGAAEVLARFGMGEDISEAVWDGVRRHPEGWVYRVLGTQLLARAGLERDAREQLGLLTVRMEDRGSRCAYDVVGHIGRVMDRDIGLVRVEDYWRPAGVRDGVVRVNGVYGVVMDYCHGQDRKEGDDWWGTVRTRLAWNHDQGDCWDLLKRGRYEALWDRCLSTVDYTHDNPDRVLWTGEVALRLGLTGPAQTAAHALLKRQEYVEEARVLLERTKPVKP